MLSSSSLSSLSIGEENNENLTGMLLAFQKLEERIFDTTTCTNTNTQLPVLPSIKDIIGCDITIDDIQLAKRELINRKVDLKMNVNENQRLPIFDLIYSGSVSPLHHFCKFGNLLIVRLLFLIGADCTQLCYDFFPMLVAAQCTHLDICQWLFEYGGDAKSQINKETSDGENNGETPLQQSYKAWQNGWDKEGRTCRWLLLNGGGQHISSQAMHRFATTGGEGETKSNLLVLWMRENIQLHDTFLQFLCGAKTIMITSSSSSSLSEPNDDGTRQCKRKRQIHQERSLQILDNHPGIMELIGDYVGLIRGKEIRMLKEFNELVIEYNNKYQSSSDDDDEDDDDDDDDNESTSTTIMEQ